MGRIYSFAFSGSAETAATGLMELANAADRIALVHEIALSQLLDFADAAEEMLLLNVKKGITTGTAGTGATEVQFDGGDAAPTAVGQYSQGVSTAGSLIQSIYWNIRIPFQHIYTPETRPVLGPNEKFVVELATAPADSITFGGYMIWEEIGT